MARKSKYEGGTKNKLTEVGTELFFQKGFDGTSIRSIAEAAGCEVGLIYYYYDTKDDLFSDVLDRFFEPYCAEFSEVTERAKKQPYRAMHYFFTKLKDVTYEFRAKYEGNMHRTVRWAIREHTLSLLEPYLKEIIKVQRICGARPMLNDEGMAVLLAHGIGSVILHEDEAWIQEQSQDLERSVNQLMGITPEVQQTMLQLGKISDLKD